MSKIRKRELAKLFLINGLPSTEFQSYVNKVGLNKIKKRDLDKIIAKKGSEILESPMFGDVYKIVSTDKSDKIMTWLTVAILVLTLISTATILIA